MEVERADGSDAFLFRIGAEYDFAIGKGFEIVPALNLDFTDDETAFVYDLGFAKKF